MTQVSQIMVGNAPVSFGIFEPEFGDTRQLPWERVMQMITAAGYEGMELGPYGYLPTNPEALSRALKRNGLRLGSSFIPIDFADVDGIDRAYQKVYTVARLLVTQGVEEVILADTGSPERRERAGMSPPGWDDAQWQRVADVLGPIRVRLQAELAMRIVVHHHAGTFVETPEEIARLLSATEVDLLLDTGHCVYGGGDPLDLLQRHPTRIRYLHYKDIDVDKLAWIRTESIDMDRAWRANVFVPLGQGSIDFPSITNYLRGCEYKGWIIVEQDVVLGDDGEAPFDLLECAKQSRTYLKGLGL